MAKVDNPRKQFHFNIIIPGLNPFLAQEVKSPDIEFDEAEHGDTGFLVKTAGLKKVGRLMVTKILSATSIDVFMTQWQNDILQTDRGGGLLPSQYKRVIMVEEFSSDGITVIERKLYRGCWPQKINGRDYSRKGSDNTTESIDFSIDQAD